MYHVELLETTGQAVGKSMTSKVPSPATPEKCYVQDVYVPFNYNTLKFVGLRLTFQYKTCWFTGWAPPRYKLVYKPL